MKTLVFLNLVISLQVVIAKSWTFHNENYGNGNPWKSNALQLNKVGIINVSSFEFSM